ncbi:MAG: TolC family protein [Acidobacteria bacterium]|nr:TolC family protein [Acidobacteriota bacterium]
MNRSHLSLVFLAVCLLPQAAAITLEEALREATTSHPLLAINANRIESAEGKRIQAGLRPNPLFVYQTEDFRTWQSPGHRFWQDADHFFYLQQTFETAAKRARRLDVALANQRRAEIELTLQKQMIAAKVRAAFWDATGALKREATLRQAVKNLSEITEYHRIQVKEGAMAEADLLRVELEENKISLLANAAAIDAQRQLIRLQREMGRGEITPITIEDSILNAPVSTSTASLVAALSQRAEIQLARQIILIASAQVGLETALATPNIDGVGGYKRSKNFDTILWGFQVQLPAFNRNQGNIASATAEDRLAHSALRSTEALIQSEYSGALREVELRSRQLETSVLPLRVRAAESARLVKEAYRLGGADLLRLLDAQRNLLDTEQLYIDSLLALRQAEASLQSATGLLQ